MFELINYNYAQYKDEEYLYHLNAIPSNREDNWDICSKCFFSDKKTEDCINEHCCSDIDRYDLTEIVWKVYAKDRT